MSKVQKTFQEGDDVSNPFVWIDEIIWAHTDMIDNRDPAEVRYELSNKIKITVEVYGQTLYEGDFDTSTSRD